MRYKKFPANVEMFLSNPVKNHFQIKTFPAPTRTKFGQHISFLTQDCTFESRRAGKLPFNCTSLEKYRLVASFKKASVP